MCPRPSKIQMYLICFVWPTKCSIFNIITKTFSLSDLCRLLGYCMIILGLKVYTCIQISIAKTVIMYRWHVRTLMLLGTIKSIWRFFMKMYLLYTEHWHFVCGINFTLRNAVHLLYLLIISSKILLWQNAVDFPRIILPGKSSCN